MPILQDLQNYDLPQWLINIGITLLVILVINHSVKLFFRVFAANKVSMEHGIDQGLQQADQGIYLGSWSQLDH